MRRARAISSLALACFFACAPDDEFPLPPIVWEGETVRVRMDDESIPVCGGTFEALDLHANLVRDAMLLDGRDRVVEYSIGNQDFVDQVCVPPSSACTTMDSGRVFSPIPFYPHETVHSVRILDSSTMFLSPAVEEGLATLFGADLDAFGTAPLDAFGILDEEYIIGRSDYYQSGQLMAILLERHGIDVFREFDVLARTIGEDRAFVEVFGETKDEFANVAEMVDLCEPSQWWMPLLECSGEEVVPDSETGRLSMGGDLTCGELDVVGPNAGGIMWTFRHFRLTTRTSELLYEIDMPEDSTLEIVGCEYGCPERFVYRGGPLDVGGIVGGIPSLEPGEYFLRMSRPLADDDGHFEIALQSGV